jgi:hypothetical protein
MDQAEGHGREIKQDVVAERDERPEDRPADVEVDAEIRRQDMVAVADERRRSIVDERGDR